MTTLPPGESPLDNPLKGWAAYSQPGDRHCLPTAMAYFYTSWRALEPEPGRYAFEKWERLWDNPAAKGKHVVLRLYLEYPNLPTGVPQWVIEKGVAMHPYDTKEVGKGLCPDWDDPNLLDPLLDFITAYGQRYNVDPRVAFVALGTLGFWGEWHTWPKDGWFARDDTQRKVVAAYRKAFPDKILLARQATSPATGALSWVGYHDDLFPEDTDGAEDWPFLPGLRKAGRQDNWKVAAIGAEMVPRQAEKWLGENWAKTQSAMEATHLSWVGPYCPANEATLSAVAADRAKAMVRRMGYDFRLVWWEWRNNEFSIEIVNQGIAPFYYPWPVQLAFLDAADRVVRIGRLPFDIRRWLPNSPATGVMAGRFGPEFVPKTARRVAIGILDPWMKRPAIRFANRLPVIDGWTVLGDL